MSAFEELGVQAELVKALEEDFQWNLPTPIQTEAIPLILGGGDVLAAAETGSGKTGAFALPVLQIVWETLRQTESQKQSSSSLTSTTTTTTTAAAGADPSSLSTSADSIKMNIDDRDSEFAIDLKSYLLCQARHPKQWHGARSNYGIDLSSSKNAGGGVNGYFEVVCNDDGLSRVGWSTSNAKRDLGTCAFGFGFGGTGKKSNARKFQDYGEPFAKGDVIGCYALTSPSDGTGGKPSSSKGLGVIGFTKNGKDLGVAFEIPTQLKQYTLFPAVVLKNAEVLINFGPEFKFPLPVSLTAANVKPMSVLQGGGQLQSSLANFKPAGPASKGRGPLSVIVEPTRDLAQQTHQELIKFARYLPEPRLSCVLLTGGQASKGQEQQLDQGADVVTATPGRLLDMVKNGKIHLNSVRFLVYDEADQLVDENERMIVQLQELCRDPRLQVLMFSATLHSHKVRQLADRLTRFATWVDLKGADAVPDAVDHCFINVDCTSPADDQAWRQPGGPRIPTDDVHEAGGKLPATLQSAEALSQATKLLKGVYLQRFIEANEFDQALIFARTKLDCDNIEQFLIKLGKAPGNKNTKSNSGSTSTSTSSALKDRYSCLVLHADRPQKERTANLQAFKNGECRFLICTDVAARGIDVAGLPCVINYCLPDKVEDYIHRTGRVGRADRSGLACSLVSAHKERVWFHRCSQRGRGCKNRKLVKSGGCTVWYDEPAYWLQIQDRIGEQVAQLPASCSVDQAVAEGRLGGGHHGYGKSRGARGAAMDAAARTAAATKEHLVMLKDQVVELGTLDRNVQLNYWSLAQAEDQFRKTFASSSSTSAPSGPSGAAAAPATSATADPTSAASGPATVDHSEPVFKKIKT